MSLEARIVVPARGVDAELSVAPGRTLALIGPNGSGKSTVLAGIAGIVRPTAGAVRFGARVLHDLDSTWQVWNDPRKRRVALVTQRDDLFPTMTVLDNVAFAARARGARRADARAEAILWLARLGLSSLAARRPGELSGGEQRRTAIARALASAPDALLLDEPFAGVDVDAASQLRTLVSTIAADLAVIISTHDALDAHLLARDVAVLANGTVAELGSTENVLTRPRSEFAARMAGLTLLRGTLTADGTLTTEEGLTIAVTAPGMKSGDRAKVAIRPRDVRLAQHGNIRETVRLVEPRGEVVRVHGAHLVADIDPTDAIGLAAGQQVSVELPLLEAYGA